MMTTCFSIRFRYEYPKQKYGVIIFYCSTTPSVCVYSSKEFSLVWMQT